MKFRKNLSENSEKLVKFGKNRKNRYVSKILNLTALSSGKRPNSVRATSGKWSYFFHIIWQHCLSIPEFEKFREKVYISFNCSSVSTECKMINIASKAGNYLRATNQVVANSLKPLAGAAIAEKKKVTTEKNEKSTLWSLSQALPANNLSVRAGVTSKLISNREFQPQPPALKCFRWWSWKLYNQPNLQWKTI